MNRHSRIYLDYCATTPVDPEVMACMSPYFTQHFGNPSSTFHSYGWEAEEAVTIAREEVATLIGARPAEVTFTSGATEAINLALFGIMEAYRAKGSHLITAKTEHKAVLACCQRLEEQGAEVTYLDVDEQGQIALSELEAALCDETVLVCLMLANNETGVIHPISDISVLAHRRGALLMTDATQAVGKVPVDVQDMGIDVAVCSSHKLYGPKGAGALYLRKRPKVNVVPYLAGGGQEKGLRPGTINVPAIVGFGRACARCQELMPQESSRLVALRNYLEQALQAETGCTINGLGSPRLPHVTNLSFDGLPPVELIRRLKRVAVSMGSACTSNVVRPSHVLQAMGVTEGAALNTFRISLGRMTTEAEIHLAIEDISQAVNSFKVAST